MNNKEIQKRLKVRQKIEKNPELVQPTAIAEKLIESYMIQYNKEEKIYDRQDMQTWDLTHLALSYKNILEIDNLMGMENLTKLQLDNNIITKIQGLDTLVNLTWLDLSFNLIDKMEGMEKLVNLQDLTLYQNKITEISGLEQLHQLNVLSIGSNQIANLDDAVLYLKGLKNKLQVLRIDDNAFKNNTEKNHRLFCIAHLEGLKYLDYTLIEQADIERAKDEHKDQISSGNDGGAEDKGEGATVDQELVDARIESTVQLLESVLKESKDYALVKELPAYGDLLGNADNFIEEKWQLYRGHMVNGSKEKKQLIANCVAKMRAAEVQAEKESIQKIDEYKKHEKHKYREIEKLRKENTEIDFEVFEEELEDKVEDLRCDLLDIEIKLGDALRTAFSQFDTRLRAVKESMKVKTGEFFEETTLEANDFTSKIRASGIELSSSLRNYFDLCDEDKVEEETEAKKAEMDDELFDFLVYTDPEEVQAALDGVEEHVSSNLNSRESKISKRLQDDLMETTGSIQSAQQARNRDVIREIVESCLRLKDSVNDQIATWRDMEGI